MSLYVQGPRDRVSHIAIPREPGVHIWTYCNRAYLPTALRRQQHTRPAAVCKRCDQGSRP